MTTGNIRVGDRRLLGGSIATVRALGTVWRDGGRTGLDRDLRPVPVAFVDCEDLGLSFARLEGHRLAYSLGPTERELDALPEEDWRETCDCNDPAHRAAH